MNLIEVFQIRVNSWEEEDLTILSDASAEQIEAVLQPMVDEERNDTNVFYDHDDYVNALKKALRGYTIQYVPQPYFIEL
jgi:hypothetical protein